MARGDVLLVQLVDVQGHEQQGRRPALAIQTDPLPQPASTIVVVPMTTSLAALRFSHTLRVDPTPQNGLDLPSVALVQQVRAIATVRIVRRLGAIESGHLSTIDDMLRRMLGL